MAAGPAMYRLSRTQRGVEASLGAGGPATSLVIGDGVFTAQRDRYFSDYPRGVRVPVTAGGVLLRQGTMLAMTTEATFEELLDPFNAGLGAGVISSPVAAADVQTISSTATGGTSTFTFGANTTGAIAFNTTAAALGTALNALASVIAAGGVVCSGGALPGASIAVTFNVPGPQALITVNGASLTGGTETIAHTTTGVLGGDIHTFSPILTADPAPKSLYYEFVKTDGITNYLASSMSAALCQTFVLDWAFNQRAGLTYTMFGRAESYGITPAAGLTVMSGREVLVGNLFNVYMDATWAALGTTKKSTLVRSGRLTVTTGLTPDYTTDGRPNLDYTRYNWGNLTAQLDLVMEFNGDAQAEINAWRIQTPSSPQYRFVRLFNQSPNLIATTGNKRSLTVDGCFVYNKEPVFSHDAATNVEIATMQLALDYDPVSAKALQAVLVNAIAAYT